MGKEWMGIGHNEQSTGPPSKTEFFITFVRGSVMNVCTLCRYQLIVHCVNINENIVCRLKINHVGNAP